MKSFRQAATAGGVSGSRISVRQTAMRFMFSPPISLNRLIVKLLASPSQQPSGSKKVPNVIGILLPKASELLQNVTLKLAIGTNATPAVQALNLMEVFDQLPISGTQVAVNSTVSVAIIYPVKTIILTNVSGISLSVWFFNASQNSWQSFGNVSNSSINLQLTARNIYTRLVAVNPSLIGCGSNDPSNTNCRAWEILVDQGVLGDPNGNIESFYIT